MRICLPCKTLNRDDASYCTECGSSLDAALIVRNPGTIVNRWYRVLNLIGHGGFGAVYEAEVLGRVKMRVALKETIAPEDIANFQKEFAVLKDMKHDNLTLYYDTFAAEGRGYLVMEYVPGQNLYDLIKRQHGPVLERLVFNYGIQISDVLEYLHGQVPPILHRDIKPQNIRLTTEGLIKLVDFGLLKQGLDSERAVARGGSVPYAPPEQWIGGTDERSDIYSLGATLYHLLTGHIPMPPSRRQGTITDPLPHPCKLNDKISPILADVVLMAMELERTRRHQSATELHTDLLEAQRLSKATRPFVSIPGVIQRGTTPLFNQKVHVAPPVAVVQRQTTSALELCQVALVGASSKTATLHPVGRLAGHGNVVRTLAWSRKAGLLATGDADGRVLIWGGSGMLRQERSLTAGMSDVFGVTWSPDAQMLASAGRDKTISLWRPATGIQRERWAAHTGAIYDIAWCPNGTSIASAGWDQTVRIWNVGDLSLKAVYTGHQYHIACISWNPDGLTLASGSLDGMLRLWDVRQDSALMSIMSDQRSISSVVWSPFGDLLATAGANGTVHIWNMQGSLVKALDLGQAGASCLDWSPDGSYIVCGMTDGSLYLWNLSDERYMAFPRAHTAGVNTVAWQPDGNMIASGGDDRTILLWQLVA
jgi:eukaryotic-like serine/threonine-protein kinase